MKQGIRHKFRIALLVFLGALTAGGTAEADPIIDIYTSQDTLLERATENPNAYQGRLLVLDGDIDEIYSERLLSIQEVGNGLIDRFLDRDEILVVVGSTDNISETARVNVSGRVYPFSISFLERRFDLSLDAETRQMLIETYSGKAIFVANAIADFSETTFQFL